MPFRTLMTIALISAMVATSPLVPGVEEQPDEYTFRLGSIKVSPAEGERSGLEGQQDYFIVQFRDIPSEIYRNELERRGISLYRYLGGNAYLARAGTTAKKTDLPDAGIRAVVSFRPEMKISRVFSEDRYLSDSFAAGGVVKIDVRFHEGIDFKAARLALAGVGVDVEQSNYLFSRIISVDADRATLESIAAIREVEMIDPAPPEPQPFNAIARERVKVKDVYKKKLYNKVTGRNIKVGVWDSGQIGTHGDFGGRVNLIETDIGVADHSTHVAGTIGGSGAGDAKAQGMADKVTLYSYNFNGDALAEMETAVNKYGIYLSNHSWGNPAGWDYQEEGEDKYYRWMGNASYGFYSARAYSLDELVIDKDVSPFWAAGNERNDAYLGPHKHYPNTTIDHQDLHPSDPEYGSIPTYANAKNSIVVGAVMKDDVITSFSSCGPTDDGRLKPDVVATGYELYSTEPDNQYDSMSGTSSSTPVVTGAAALLSELHQRLFKSRISSSLLKALLIHGARDLGRPGPDYLYGYGIVDTELSAQVLGASAQAAVASAKKTSFDVVSKIVEDVISNGKKKVIVFEVPEGADELRATLVWHDPAGPALVNDLDIWMKTLKTKKALPFCLDPNNPDAPAIRNRNVRDNVEYVLVENPKAGKWKIFIKGTRVALGPQGYALVISAGRANDSPQILDEGKIIFNGMLTSSSSDWNNIEEKTTFAAGDDFYAYVYFRVVKNANYGSYYGTISAAWYIRNSNGEVIFKKNAADGGFYPNAVGTNWRWRIGSSTVPYEIPSEMPSGDYNVEVTVTMHNGISESATTTFTVQ